MIQCSTKFESEPVQGGDGTHIAQVGLWAPTQAGT